MGSTTRRWAPLAATRGGSRAGWLRWVSLWGERLTTVKRAASTLHVNIATDRGGSPLLKADAVPLHHETSAERRTPAPRAHGAPSPSRGRDTTTGRVGFVAGALEAGGGLERYELATAQGLAHRGWGVVCFYQKDGDLLPEWSATAELHERTRLDDAHIVDALSHVDVIYVHDYERFETAVRYGISARRPVVGHLHLPPMYLRTGWRARLRGRHAVRYDPRALGPQTQIARFIAVSHHTRALWVDAGLPDDRIEVVHNGIDLTTYRPARRGEREEVRARLGVADDAFVIGFVGRIEPAKGIEELLRAVNAVAERTRRHIVLVVVGEPSRWHTAEESASYVASLRKQAAVDARWLGHRNDVPELYRGMDLVVVPSQWDEPFGLVAAEALASEVPVVATRRGGLSEVLTGPLSVNLVDTSWRAIARGIERHIQDPTRGAWIGQQGRRVVLRDFEVAQAMERIENVLRGAM